MKVLGKSLGLLTAAVVLAAFALPASAAKTISLSVTPIPAPLSSQTTVVSAVISNTGNSNANSFEIDWLTSPYFTVTSASADGASGSCSTAGIKGPAYSSCVFLKQLPTKTSVTITLNVQVTNQCNAMSIDWYAYAWTGSPGPVSQSFTLQGTPPVTASSPNCTIEFVTQPKDAFVGSTVTGAKLNSTGAPVTVRLLNSGTPAVGTTVSLGATLAGCATTDTASAPTDATGTVTLNFTAAVAGSCALTAAATGFGSVTSQSFTVVQPQGQLGCDPTNNAFGTSGPGGLVLSATRLPNVNDPAPDAVGGSTAPACVVVPYTVSTTCPNGLSGTCTNFVYDPLDQGTHMAFTFHWTWPPEAIPAGGIGAITDTEQLFLNGNPTPLSLDLCPEIVPNFVAGTFVGLATGSPSPDDQDFALPGTQAGCLVRRVVIQVGGQVQLIEDAYVQGDYVTSRH
jgi:hypothetical protein